MSKAYDRVEWSFLEAAMLKVAFHYDWVSLIMNCVTTVSYAVLLNESLGKTFSPSRGLGQGAPPSPYLLPPLCRRFFGTTQKGRTWREIAWSCHMQTSIDSSSLFVWRMIVFFLQEPRFKKLIRSVKLCSAIRRFQARGLILISQLSHIAEMCHDLNEL